MYLWVYFSYKGSPCGFQLGCIDINNKNENFIIIKKRPQKLIEDFFEASEVKTAYGKFPNTEEFIYLTKKINGTTNKGEKLYLNFAFQVDNRDKFLKIYNFIETNRENGKLFDVFSKIVHIEEVSEFGYTINTEELKSILSDIEKTDIKKEIENKLYIESESIEEKLVNRLELEKQKLGIVKSNKVADYEIDTIESISQKKNENLVDSNSNSGDNCSPCVDNEIKAQEESLPNTPNKLSIVTQEVGYIVESTKKGIASCKMEFQNEKELWDKHNKSNLLTDFVIGGVAFTTVIFGAFGISKIFNKSKESDKQKKSDNIPSEKIDSKEDEQYSDL